MNSDQPLIQIKAMLAADLSDGAVALSIDYSFATSPFGEVLIARSQQGICAIDFIDEVLDGKADQAAKTKTTTKTITKTTTHSRKQSLAALKALYPKATFTESRDALQQSAQRLLQQADKGQGEAPITLHLQATDFQLSVWQALLSIPFGQTRNYGQIAAQMGKPSAARAVGTAIGKNPVAFLIPCHRVVQAGGGLGGFRWGEVRKAQMIAWEAAQARQAGESAASKEPSG